MSKFISGGVESGMQTDLPGYTRFRELVTERMAEAGERLFAIAAIDIDHFKLFNEIYGRGAGEEILLDTARLLTHYADAIGGIAGHFGNDDFVLMMPWEEMDAEQLYYRISYKIEETYRRGFYPSVGICVIRDRSDTFDDIYDRAVIALNSIRASFTEHISIFDDKIHGKTREDLKILIDAHRGLAEGEFTFFLQPKCVMKSGKIIGAEALIRWNSAEKGMISPGVFIPVLEENDCISRFDMYIWEEVCRWQRSLIDDGIEPLPVSVNVSQADFGSMDVVEFFKALVGRYDIDPSLIELEITESAVVEAGVRIDEAIERLHEAGFRVLMDDFGTGSSSLHSLRELKFDVIKTDIRFLDRSGHSRKGIDIMESVRNMVSMLGMPMIVEGVETRDQVEDLISIGCNYAQGFFFYKPIPADQYRTLIANEHNVDRGTMVREDSGGMRVIDLLDSNLYSKETLNSIFGAVAFVETSDEGIRVERTNDRLNKLLEHLLPGDSTAERLKACFGQDPEHARMIFTIAEMNLVDGCSDSIRITDMNGRAVRLPLRVFLLNERENGKLFYVNVVGIEPELNYEDLRKELHETNAQLSFLQSALNRLPNPIFMKDGDARFLFFNDRYAKAFGMQQADYIGKTVLDLDYLPEDDRERFQQEDIELIRTESELSYESDFLFSDEMNHFSMYWSTGVHDKRTGRRGLVGEIVDITRERQIREELDATMDELRNTSEKLEKMKRECKKKGLTK